VNREIERDLVARHFVQVQQIVDQLQLKKRIPLDRFRRLPAAIRIVARLLEDVDPANDRRERCPQLV
jgi:hypothetical protein